jgi:hypothetical protein
MEENKFTNLFPLGVHHRILRSNNPVNVFFEEVLPHYKDQKSFATAVEDKRLRLRPRELLGLCLMSIQASAVTGVKWAPGTDPMGRDGLIMRVDETEHVKSFRGGLIIEQVFIPAHDKRDLTRAIIESIELKSSRGRAYTDKINLVVLVGKVGDFDVTQILPVSAKSEFGACYLFAMKEPMPFTYYAATLKAPDDPLEYYSIIFDASNKSASIMPKGRFIPIK